MGVAPGGIAPVPPAIEQPAPVPVEASDWNGYRKQAFSVGGHAAYVVIPAVAAPGKPWVWRTSFPDYRPVVDLELLRQGYHLGYIEILDMLGSDPALDLVDRFYSQVRAQWGLAEKMAVEPCSRGGLPAYRYAARHPERIACIYGDVPVMDFKSWPLQRPEKERASEWPKITASYGFKDDAEAMAYRGNPIDRLAPIAAAGIPIRHVICLNDRVVPPEQNTLEAQRRLEKLGGRMEVVSVAQSDELEGHHFPYPDVYGSVRFIMNHADVLPAGHEYFQLRDGLANSRTTFEKEKTGRVVFLGGSITFNPGWRDEVMNYLQRKFPETKFEFIEAGIPSMGSTGHAFRLEPDVFKDGPVDLLFVEAAVNDGENLRGHPASMLRGMEGVVRHVRIASPRSDIVQIHFASGEALIDYAAGTVPESIRQHERVAAHYGCVSLDLAKECADRIRHGELTWAGEFKGNPHPPPYGQRLYANSIMRMLDAAFASAAQFTPHKIPRSMLDEFSYVRGRFGNLEDARLLHGFTLDPSWKPADGGAGRAGFVNVPALVGTEPGAEFEFTFDGRGAGLLITAGPDAGLVESSVDGGAWAQADTFTRWSSGLHLPWPIMLADELAPGRHTIRVRIARDHNPLGKGSALRVMRLLLN